MTLAVWAIDPSIPVNIHIKPDLNLSVGLHLNARIRFLGNSLPRPLPPTLEKNPTGSAGHRAIGHIVSNPTDVLRRTS